MEVLGTISAAIALVDASRKIFESLQEIARTSYSNWEEFGFFRTILLYTLFPQARSVVARIRKHVLHDQMESQFGGLTTERFESIKTLAAEHALSIKKSYDKSLNIIAVAVRNK